jgi:hypothetical protein
MVLLLHQIVRSKTRLLTTAAAAAEKKRKQRFFHFCLTGKLKTIEVFPQFFFVSFAIAPRRRQVLCVAHFAFVEYGTSVFVISSSKLRGITFYLCAPNRCVTSIIHE